MEILTDLEIFFLEENKKKSLW